MGILSDISHFGGAVWDKTSNAVSKATGAVAMGASLLAAHDAIMVDVNHLSINLKAFLIKSLETAT